MATDVGGATAAKEEGNGHAQPPSRLFELKSVVVHVGKEVNRGHYVTVVRNGDRCVLLDDDEVRVVEPEVLRSFYGVANPQTQGSRRGAAAPQRGGSSNGWGASDNGLSGGRSEPNRERSTPNNASSGQLYERAQEGICCGYLLFYEAVDSAPDHDSGSVVDIGSAAEWMSEERNLSDSDDEEDNEDRARTGSHEKAQPCASDDGELTQAFEQRCIPRGPNRQTNGAGAGAPGADARNRGGGNGVAWAAADADGGKQASGGGAAGGRTLGSVVPAAGTTEVVSPSRVNVATVPSPRTSTQGPAAVEASG